MRYVFKERGEVSKDGTEELLSVSKYTGVNIRATTTDREARAASLIGYKKCWTSILLKMRLKRSNL